MRYWSANSYHYSSTPLPQYSRASSNTEPALALFEKGAQLGQIIFAGLEGDRVDIVPAQQTRKFLLALIHETAKTRSRRAVGRVDLNLITGLGVFQGDDADVWQNFFPFIVNVDRHEIVPSSTHRQRPRK